MRWLILMIGLTLTCGCAVETRRNEEHFAPAPPVSPPPQPAQWHAFTVDNKIYAQTFHVSTDGTLLEFHFDPQVQSDKTSEEIVPLPLEIRRVIDGNPSWDDDDLLARFAAPVEMLQSSDGDNDPLRLDLRALNIEVRKGEELALVLLPESDQPLRYGAVRDLYEQGALLQWARGQWYPKDNGNSDLIFRVVVDEETSASDRPAAPVAAIQAASTTRPTTVPFIQSDAPMPGRVIAHAIHQYVPAPPPPPVIGSWQTRLVPFEHEGKWHVQWEHFNGTSRFGGQAVPELIWVMRLPDGKPRTIHSVDHRDGPFPLMYEYRSLNPGQGIIVQFPLGTLSDEPGKYRVTAILRQEKESIIADAEFDVP